MLGATGGGMATTEVGVARFSILFILVTSFSGSDTRHSRAWLPI